jgi:hypothetical protein
MDIQINEFHGVGIRDKICVIESKVEMSSTLDPKSYNLNFVFKNLNGLLPLLTNAFVIEHIFTWLLMDPSMVWCFC